MTSRLFYHSLSAAILCLAFMGCSSGDTRGNSGGGDGDNDSETEFDPEYFGNLQGIVTSAAGFPISGALVYVTDDLVAPIPDYSYCYECDDMSGKNWTLSNSDGSWYLGTVPKGAITLVTRKGFFQRHREIEVIGGSSVQDVPQDYSQLPGEDGVQDDIPNYAVLQSGPDYPENLLAKMGLGSLTTSGVLDTSQPYHFDLYSSDSGDPAGGSGATSFIFSSQDYLDQYHMVFFPCICNPYSMPGSGSPSAAGFTDMLRAYVSGGGKIYSSCWASQWAEQPFPDVIDFNGDDNMSNAGNVGSYETTATVNDAQMKSWLSVVEPDENLSSWPISGAWVQMDSLSSTSYTGHGVLADGTIEGPVIPSTWITDNQHSPGAPLTVTYPYDCGKVFYSSYQVVESSTSPEIRPQEWILIYLFLEVGVCEGEYDPII